MAALWLSLIAAVRAQPALDRLEQEFKPNTPAKAGTPPANDEAGYLGVVAELRKGPGPGLHISKISPASPAAQADILAGDLIIAIDDQPILKLDDMAAALQGRKPGDRVQFTIERDKKAELRNIVLGRPPARRLQGDNTPATTLPANTGSGAHAPSNTAIAPPAEVERPRRLGIRTVAITDDIRQLYDLPSTRGALVSEVIVGSPAHAAGIPLDAAIVEANGQAVASPDFLARLVAALAPKKELSLSYYSRGQLVRKVLRLESIETVAKPVTPDTPPMPDAVNDFVARLEILEARIRQLEKELQDVQARVPQPAKITPAPAPQ